MTTNSWQTRASTSEQSPRAFTNLKRSRPVRRLVAFPSIEFAESLHEELGIPIRDTVRSSDRSVRHPRAIGITLARGRTYANGMAPSADEAVVTSLEYFLPRSQRTQVEIEVDRARCRVYGQHIISGYNNKEPRYVHSLRLVMPLPDTLEAEHKAAEECIGAMTGNNDSDVVSVPGFNFYELPIENLGERFQGTEGLQQLEGIANGLLARVSLPQVVTLERVKYGDHPIQ